MVTFSSEPISETLSSKTQIGNHLSPRTRKGLTSRKTRVRSKARRAMMPEGNPRVDSDNKNNASCANFICGVVEGFYGRPWTSEQRKKLFKRMNKLGMNTYIYAPKDDSKHRMYWRELYTVEEADMLTSLIEAAEENGVTFVYALSPGLDMTYSSPKEVSCLKRKLSQVMSFGCKAFALLFDDIEADMSEADKGFFQSFAFAQVSVTNEAYQHVHEPRKFFFCPTEYCASRAVPTVSQSEYLQTIGSKLLPGIDVMWTGPKVISKRISIKSIEEVATVLQRPPLIWDNIHANDYDQKRIFLGPYDGRSPELIPYLRGVLTNPNCEFESNFMALHTLAQWSQSNAGGVKKDCILSASPVNSADIKLETDGEYTVDEDSPPHSSAHVYNAKQAVNIALVDWHPEFLEKCVAPRKLNSVHPVYPPFSFPTILPPTPVIDTKSTSSGALPIPVPKTALDPMAVLEMSDNYVKPPDAIIPHNGLIDASSSSSSSDDSLDMACPITSDMGEPMDYAPSGSSSFSPPSSSVDGGCVVASPLDDVDDDVNGGGTASMIIDASNDQQRDEERIDDDKDTMMTSDSFTIADVTLIVDLFYLPFEHGRWAVDSLTEFHWLKTNCSAALGSSDKSAEWQERSVVFLARLKHMCSVLDRFNSIPNKALLHELFPYVWDIKAVLILMSAFVQWLGKCTVKNVGQSCLLGGPYSWGNRGYGDYTMSGEREPWLFRGGVLGEFQRMLPFECCTDLLFYTIPDTPSTTMFTVRPYSTADLESVYRVCLKTCNDGADGSHLYPNHPHLVPDILIGCYLEHSADMCFVVEDSDGVLCGYVLSCTDARAFQHSYRTSWLPHITAKYSHLSVQPSTTSATTTQEVINEFITYMQASEPSRDHTSDSTTDTTTNTKTVSSVNVDCSSPESLLIRHPSMIRVDVLRDRLSADPTGACRALACAVAALKVAVSPGVFTRLHVRDTNTAEFYRRLGFFEIPYLDSTQPTITASSSSSSSSSTSTAATGSDIQTADESTDARTTAATTQRYIHMGRII